MISRCHDELISSKQANDVLQSKLNDREGTVNTYSQYIRGNSIRGFIQINGLQSEIERWRLGDTTKNMEESEKIEKYKTELKQRDARINQLKNEVSRGHTLE